MIQRHLVTTLGVASVMLLTWLLRDDDAPGMQSSGKPDDADYCSVLLMPSLAQGIGLDLPMRIRVATKGAGLLGGLLNSSGTSPMMTMASDVADKVGADMVDRRGREAREMLTPEARSAFEELFADGKLIHLGFWTEKAKSNAPGGDQFFLTFGWFEEEKHRPGVKSLRAIERELQNCYRWIGSVEEAERLAETDHDVVRRAAEKWLSRNAAASLASHAADTSSQGAEPSRALAEEKVRQAQEAAERLAEESRLASEEFQRRAEESRLQAEARQAEFREKMAAQKAAAEQAAEEARREGEEFSQRMEESRRRMEDSRMQRAAEAEAFREKVRARQEAVRKRIEEGRREGG